MSFSLPLPSLLQSTDSFCVYESLSPLLEKDLRRVLSQGSQSFADHLIFYGNILKFMGHLFSQLAKRTSAEGKTFSQAELQRLFAVREQLRSHIFGQPPTVEEFAHALGTSPTQLKTQYKALFGKPIYQYYLELKMETAADLLRESDKTISELGYTLGVFQHISIYPSLQESTSGKTPRAYRG